MIDAVQFRDYVFPHNPREITVTRDREAVALFCPGAGSIVQDLGRRERVVRCTGSFFGETFGQAMAEAEAFRKAADREGAGSLFLPGMAPFRAHLRSFILEASGDGRILPYTMVFVEEEAVS